MGIFTWFDVTNLFACLFTKTYYDANRSVISNQVKKASVFRTGAKIYLSEKYFGVRCTLKETNLGMAPALFDS